MVSVTTHCHIIDNKLFVEVHFRHCFNDLQSEDSAQIYFCMFQLSLLFLGKTVTMSIQGFHHYLAFRHLQKQNKLPPLRITCIHRLWMKLFFVYIEFHLLLVATFLIFESKEIFECLQPNLM